MSFTCPLLPAVGGAVRRLRVRRVGLLTLAVLLLGSMVSAAGARADAAPGQWQPTTADVARTVRACPVGVGAPTPPVCWSMIEDSSVWMAPPAGSRYGWAQCTYYVGVMRPDIWNNRAPPTVDPLTDWDAWTWAEHARAEGLAVDGAARPGDVVVFSRAAADNATGHVAIVDAVGPPNPATGDVPITVSEMNVDGLDDASLGQGDTTTLLLGRSQLRPAMIQFIHRPGRGYAPPPWPAGSLASQPPASTTAQDASLAVGLLDDRVATVSESTAPVHAVVTVPGGIVVERLRLRANTNVALHLPTGRYTVCVSQPASGQWGATGACTTSSWQAPPVATTIRLGAIRGSGRSLTVAVRVARQPGLASGTTFPARIQVAVLRRGGLRATAARDTYDAVARLHAGRQLLRIAVGPGVAGGLGGACIRVTIIAVGAAVRGAATKTTRRAL